MTYTELCNLLHKLKSKYNSSLNYCGYPFGILLQCYDLDDIFERKHECNWKSEIDSTVESNFNAFVKDIKDAVSDYSKNKVKYDTLRCIVHGSGSLIGVRLSRLFPTINIILSKITEEEFNWMLIERVDTKIEKMYKETITYKHIIERYEHKIKEEEVKTHIKAITLMLMRQIPDQSYTEYIEITHKKYQDLGIDYQKIKTLEDLICNIGVLELFCVCYYGISSLSLAWPQNDNISLAQYLYNQVLRFGYNEMKSKKLALIGGTEYNGAYTENLVYLIILEDILMQALNDIGSKEGIQSDI